ncbi:glycosyl transferase [Methylobacterium sp. Leaf399]|uniref:glycosyltransferase family 4 protein n=1 Tax=unclassified Methylobacterium TaxID=2615210 RepID=UPI0006F2BF58|nr:MULTISPECIES: glycosyltransferase family 4 protein [unclassified Methylobacterium]KQP61474.1 glycosyl transferase [Methylobacterium sp. Leaf108]KQT19624.1 glycosyl transferase [Methylobacterium sp. Leaf399]KQT80677.1 glycosyl transferase [Methylobacterium sp. Leaf466]
MRIAQIAPLSEAVPPKFYGGTERVVSWITEELVRQGHDVTLFASGDSETSAKLAACTPEGLRLLGYRDHTASHLAMLHQIRRRAHEFDVLHFHIDLLQYPMFEDLNHKCLTTMHGRLDVPDFMPVYRTFTGMPLVSISDNQREPMPKTVNWLSTIHHGLPPENCTFYPEAKGGYLAFLGRISPEKRPDRAIEMAIRSGTPLKIAAKVDKADQDYWDEVIEPMIHHPLVEFIGEINEEQKKDFLGNALALAFPIDWPEPFGLVMIEAMSSGTPVIAFRNGSVPEVIADGVSGVLCDTMDDAVAAVAKVKAMSRAGVRRHFEGNFTAERMVKKYVAAYEMLLAGRPDLITVPNGMPAFVPHYGDLNGSARPSLAAAAAMPA